MVRDRWVLLCMLFCAYMCVHKHRHQVPQLQGEVGGHDETAHKSLMTSFEGCVCNIIMWTCIMLCISLVTPFIQFVFVALHFKRN